MREGTQLGVDAYGVRGYTQSCRGASTPSRHSFAHYCEGLGQRFIIFHKK